MTQFVSWIYNLQGERRKLYVGRSFSVAQDRCDTAIEIIQVMKLTCTLTIVESHGIALDGPQVYRRDYQDGWFTMAHHDITLALDRKDA